ncbi:nucleotidyl transferase AbiEii/AbiGii toxin family protein [Patescibacteria group bacterium]
MREQVINKKTKSILESLAQSGIIKDYYLAGGTALALQYGHRKSIDLDFFNQKSFNTVELRRNLTKIGKLIIVSEEKNTLNLNLANVKLSFFGYPYKIIFPFIKWNGIKLADPRDIACMKLDAVSSRGCKKDFFDLYFILKKYSLEELLEIFDKKYKGIKYNKIHILKSLTYFFDAENEPMPVMLENVSWRKVKDYFEKLITELIL